MKEPEESRSCDAVFSIGFCVHIYKKRLRICECRESVRCMHGMWLVLGKPTYYKRRLNIICLHAHARSSLSNKLYATHMHQY